MALWSRFPVALPSLPTIWVYSRAYSSLITSIDTILPTLSMQKGVGGGLVTFSLRCQTLETRSSLSPAWSLGETLTDLQLPRRLEAWLSTDRTGLFVRDLFLYYRLHKTPNWFSCGWAHLPLHAYFSGPVPMLVGMERHHFQSSDS